MKAIRAANAAAWLAALLGGTLGAAPAALGWQVVDRRPGWWILSAAEPPRRSVGPAMEMAIVLAAGAAIASVAIAGGRRWRRHRSR